MTNQLAELVAVLILVYVGIGFFYSIQLLWRDDYFITFNQWMFRWVFWFVAVPYDLTIYVTHKLMLCNKLSAVLPERMGKGLFWKPLNLLNDMETALFNQTDLRADRCRLLNRLNSPKVGTAAQPVNIGAAHAVRVGQGLLVGRITPADRVKL